MFDRPTTLSETQQAEVQRAVDDLWLRVIDAVERLLADVPEPLTDHLYAVAFESNDVVSDRARRPKIEIAFLVEQVYLATDPEEDRLDELLEFTVATHEYYDIADDIVDDDVTDSEFTAAFLALQMLLPLFVRRLPALGDDAVAFWSDRATDLVVAPFREVSTEPTVETYLSVVDRQANLFGFLTGLAAIAADGDRDDIERAERIGRNYYAYEQFLLDRGQVDGETWNLWTLASEETAVDILLDRRESIETDVDALPETSAAMIRSLVAHDVDAWLTAFDSEAD